MGIEDLALNVLYFSIASGLITWLFKSLYSHSLDKDIEAFKHKLKIEENRHSKLYEKRAQVIAGVYRRLDIFDTEMRNLLSPLQISAESKQEKLKKAGDSGNEFTEYYTQHKIYFDKKTVALIDEINKEFRRAWVEFTTYPVGETDQFESNEQRKARHDAWFSAWERVSKKIPSIKEKLEEDFREILGIEKRP